MAMRSAVQSSSNTPTPGGAVSSRRALLAAAAGALAGLFGQAVANPLGARAANGDTLTAGHTKSATKTTGVTTTAGDGFKGTSADMAAAGL